jgi:hypothetical protein
VNNGDRDVDKVVDNVYNRTFKKYQGLSEGNFSFKTVDKMNLSVK